MWLEGSCPMRPRVHAPRPAAMAGLAVTGAGLVYLLSLLANIAAGFPMPPVWATRFLASLSVLVGAPAFLLLVYCVSRRPRRRWRSLPVLLTAGFVLIAVTNRLVQLATLTVSSGWA